VLVVFDLLELYIQQVIQFVEVLFKIVNGDAAADLEVDGLNPAIEFALHLADLGVVIFVGLGVFVHPELAVGNRLVHARLQGLVAQSLARILRFHIRHLHGKFVFSSQHHVLHLLQVFSVLLKLRLQRHRCVNFLL